MSFLKSLSRASSPLTLAVLFLLLALLGTLQYRWAGELSEAERTRMRTSARSRAEALGRDFDREVTRAFQRLQLDPEALRTRDFAGYGEAYQHWRGEAAHPDLVKEVFLVEREGAGIPGLSRFDPSRRTFEPAAWPDTLQPLRARLEERGRRPIGLIAEEIPAVMVPVGGFDREGPRGPGPGGPPGPPPEGLRGPGPGRSFRPPDFVLLVLDLDYVRDRLLPALAERHFGGAHGLDYDLAVVTQDDPPRVVWRSSPDFPVGATADASAGILEVRFEEAAGPNRRFGFGFGGRPGPPPPSAGHWHVLAVHHGGSIGQAVAAARLRNLAVGFGILVLLGASVAFLVTAARRAERLARQQMEFVAGVTHELRTPLAVIRSAGENLADGLVAEPPQVRSYGALVRDEGRRLTDMVEQVLELADANGGRRADSRAPVDVGALLDEALRACEPELRTAGVVAEKDVPKDLPPILGDPGALRRALRNLLENAIKYGGDSRWIGVRAGADGGARGPEVWVAVEDHGLGVPPEEVPRIFEPFYRGRDATTRQIRGSGLGLSLVRRIVESHGGRVTVERGRERGSVFTIHLPAQPGAAPAAP